MSSVLVFGVAFALTAGLIHMLAPKAHQWGLVDRASSARKVHEGAVPVVGGIAMGLTILGMFLVAGFAEPTALVIVLAVAITLVGGVLDDRHDNGPMLKFSFQIAAAVLLAFWGGARLTHLGDLVSAERFWLGNWGLPLSIFAIIGVMNAVNMMDGLDGLAGCIALSACLCFGIAAMQNGDALVTSAVLTTAGAVVGFLLYNARSPLLSRAAVFMGDTGSLLLGLLLAWISIQLAMADDHPLAPITAVWILALPLADSVSIMLRRLVRGRSPFKADREHLHHILLALGISHERTVVILFVASLAFGFAGLAAQLASVPEHVMFYSAMAILAAYIIATEVACRRLGLRADSALTPGTPAS